MSDTNLPQWKCHKVVRAAKILAIKQAPEAQRRIPNVGMTAQHLYPAELALEGGYARDVSAEWMTRNRQTAVGGYLVEYEDGYTSYSPADTFEAGYTLSPHGAGFIKPDTDKQVFFYEQDFYVLSNFSAFNVEFDAEPHLSRIFETAEHCYHWLKFDHIGGRGVQQLLLQARSAHDAFRIAQDHKQWRLPNWDEIKVPKMKGILVEKSNQHEYVRRKLLATGERELIEDSWRDPFWGWGPNRDGLNMLGKLWMEVRAELRAAGG